MLNAYNFYLIVFAILSVMWEISFPQNTYVNDRVSYSNCKYRPRNKKLIFLFTKRIIYYMTTSIFQ